MDYQKAPFRYAVDIPRGGVALGKALNEYGTGNPNHPVLVADDVYTTGTSFREFCNSQYPGEIVFQWCVFARQHT